MLLDDSEQCQWTNTIDIRTCLLIVKVKLSYRCILSSYEIVFITILIIIYLNQALILTLPLEIVLIVNVI